MGVFGFWRMQLRLDTESDIFNPDSSLIHFLLDGWGKVAQPGGSGSVIYINDQEAVRGMLSCCTSISELGGEGIQQMFLYLC